MRQVVLVRHGESELNASNRRGERYFCGQFDAPLTARGRQQAREVGIQLARDSNLQIQSAVSSVLSRAVETLEIIANELQPPPTVLPPMSGFNERCLGSFEGRTEAEVYCQFPEYHDLPNYNRFRNDFHQRAPGGENLTDVTRRVWAAWQEVIPRVSGDVLLVSHSKAIQTWLGCALELSEEETLLLKIPNTVPIVVDIFIPTGSVKDAPIYRLRNGVHEQLGLRK